MIAGLTTIGLLFVLDCFLGALVWHEARRQRIYWARVAESKHVPIPIKEDEIKELTPEMEEHYRVNRVTEPSARYKEWVRQQREHGH